jgi:hypothetical protein
VLKRKEEIPMGSLEEDSKDISIHYMHKKGCPAGKAFV